MTQYIETARRSGKQNALFHKLLLEADFNQDEKESLVLAVSQNRTKRSAELDVEEMKVAITKLAKKINDTANRRRARIAAVARDIGYIEGGNYTKLNDFVMKHFQSKTIFEVPKDRLSDVIVAIERVRDWKESKALKKQLA